MRFQTLIIGLIFAYFSTASQGQWYQAEGHAVIKQGQKQTARQNAIQQALKRALLVAGASVSSVQQVVNGLLTQDQLSIRASGVVDSIQIVKETYHDDEISVTIRADIFPQEQACFSANYKKSLLLTRSNLLHRQQANIGKIYALDTEVIKRFSNTISNTSHYVDARLALNKHLPFNNFQLQENQEQLKQMSMSLARMSDTQFVLYSTISDLSFDNKVQNSWQFWQQDQFNRNFAINLYLYNGENGEMVFSKRYQGQAEWPYKKRYIADVTSAQFWHDNYGQMLQQILEQATIDIDENMMCQETKAKILSIKGNQVTLNLGAKQGVKIGDQFTLLHWHNFVADNGQTYAGYNISPYQVEIILVTQNTAMARSTTGALLGNIQRNDFAIKK